MRLEFLHLKLKLKKIYNEVFFSLKNEFLSEQIEQERVKMEESRSRHQILRNQLFNQNKNAEISVWSEP